MPSKKKETESGAIRQQIDNDAQQTILFTAIKKTAIPRATKGKTNAIYDTILKQFMQATDVEACELKIDTFGKVKPTSIAHTLRMRIESTEQYKDIKVQLNAKNGTVYLVKP